MAQGIAGSREGMKSEVSLSPFLVDLSSSPLLLFAVEFTYPKTHPFEIPNSVVFFVYSLITSTRMSVHVNMRID